MLVRIDRLFEVHYSFFVKGAVLSNHLAMEGTIPNVIPILNGSVNFVITQATARVPTRYDAIINLPDILIKLYNKQEKTIA